MMSEDLAKIALYLRLNGYPCEIVELDVSAIRFESAVREHAVQALPFPGMAFYEENEANIFRGREAETERLRIAKQGYKQAKVLLNCKTMLPALNGITLLKFLASFGPAPDFVTLGSQGTFDCFAQWFFCLFACQFPLSIGWSQFDKKSEFS